MTNDDRKRPEKPAAAAPKLRKRFSFQKLEERIAPSPHYNPQSNLVGTGTGNNGGGGGGSSTSSGLSGGGSIY